MGHICRKVRETLKNNIVCLIIVGLLGLGAYVVGFVWVKDGIWHEILLQIGNILVIGVAIGFLSNGETFLEIYQKAIQKVICGGEFLDNQKDVSKYWKAISKQMFKNKFPNIHEEFLEVINANLPTDEVSYYDQYEMDSTMEWKDEANNIVKVTDVVTFDLITDTKEEFVYPLKNWIKTSKKDGEVKNNMVYFKVDGEDKKDSIKDGITYKNGEKCTSWDIKLSGKQKYHIEYKVEKELNLLEDHCKAFRAKYIVRNCRVEYLVPENIQIQFESRGTLKEFEDTGSQRNNKISKRYRGILLPRQGFVMALYKK